MHIYTESEFKTIIENFKESSDGGNFALSGASSVVEFEIIDEVYFVIATDLDDDDSVMYFEDIAPWFERNKPIVRKKIYGSKNRTEMVEFYLELQRQNLMKY